MAQSDTDEDARVTFESDWCRVWTPEKAEEELVNFKFKGPGWYHSELVIQDRSDWMLVVPFGEGRFRFCIFSEDPRPTFEKILKLPVLNG